MGGGKRDGAGPSRAGGPAVPRHRPLTWPAAGGADRAARSASVMLGAVLLGGGLFLLGAAALLAWQDGTTSAEARQLSARLVALIQDQPRWLAWALIALVPAVCEELLFRGWVLAGFVGGVVLATIKRGLGAEDQWTEEGMQLSRGVLQRLDALAFAAPVFFHLTLYFYA